MLILGRHPGEWIVITLEDGREIKILVKAGITTLGFVAPKSINIVREEIQGKFPDLASNM